MEVPHVFGDFNHLMGVVNKPDSTKSNVGVILLTAGMLHHVGPFRLYVNLARRLEQLGIPSLRFDLSGIGESLPVASGGTSLQRAANETRQAMDFLQENYGVERFVLFGLCSGADDGFHTAIDEDRIDGLVLLDGCGYPTAEFNKRRVFAHYLPRVKSLTWWKRKVSRSGNDAPSSLPIGNDIREFPSRDVAAKQLQGLVDRGTKLHFIYSGGVSEYYNHESQFDEMFHDVDFRGQVTSRFLPEMDHVAILCEDRAELVTEISDWVSRSFTPASADADQDELVAV